MNYLVLTAATEAAKFDYMQDIGFPFGRMLLLFACILIPIAIIFAIQEIIQRKKAGLPATDKDGASRFAGASKALLSLKIVFTILFLPFVIISWAIRKK